MARIVFISYGITSYLNASYRLAHQLQQKGHEVTFISSLDASKSVTGQGFEFVLLKEEHNLRQDGERFKLESMPASRRYFHRKALIRVGEDQKHYFVKCRELENTIRRLKPDLLLIDEELTEHIIASLKFGVPVLLLQFFISTRKAPDVPPLSSNIIPKGTFWSTARVEAVWQLLKLKRKLISAFAPIYYRKTDRRSIVRGIARREQFEFSARVELDQGLPIIFKDIPTLFLAAWEFDFPHNIDCVENYVGPMVALERQEAGYGSGFNAVIQRLAGGRSISAKARPLIYCSIGTFWLANADYVRRIIQVFAIRRDWDLVMSVGSSASVADFEPLPPNVRLFNSVPQLEMLQHADLMLTHGGISTINECIFLGVPMIVYSGGKIDQNGNAARVEYHGLGLRGNIHRESSAQIISKIERVLIEPQFKTNVQKMRQIYLAYHNSGKGVQIIESMLQQSPRGPRGEPDPALSNKVELS